MFVRKMLARALPLTALGLAARCPAYAVEEQVKADDVYVTATRVEKELQDVPMSVSVMTGEDIKRSPARTIGELLQDVPGVEIRNSGGQGFKRNIHPRRESQPRADPHRRAEARRKTSRWTARPC